MMKGIRLRSLLHGLPGTVQHLRTIDLYTVEVTLKRIVSAGLLSALSSYGLLSIPARAQTNNEFAQQITDQLDTLATSLEADGYVEVESYIDTDGLNVEDSKIWDLSLEPNVEYVITAVCDNDCQDLDLLLLEDNTVVDEDRAADAYPMLVGVPGEHRYQAEVIMRACTIEPCYSGLRIFRQR